MSDIETDDPIRFYADRKAIHSLVWRYAEIVDEGRFDEWETCFTEDVVLDYPWGHVEGREGLNEQCRSLLAPFATSQHLIGNLDITFLGEGRAKGRANYIVTVVREVERRPTRAFHDGGIYLHEYRLTGDGWRFNRIDCISRWNSVTFEKGTP